jgi:hypothetical protein
MTFVYDLQSDGSGTGSITIPAEELESGTGSINGYMSLGLSGAPNVRTMIGGHVVVFSVTSTSGGLLDVVANSFYIRSKSGTVFVPEDGEGDAFSVTVTAFAQTPVSESGSMVLVSFSLVAGDWAIPVESGSGVQMIWAYGRNIGSGPGVHTQRDGMTFFPENTGCDMVA